jgi:hypothetical protein
MDKHTFTLYFPHTNDVFLLSGMNAVFMYITGYYFELLTKRADHNKRVSTLCFLLNVPYFSVV